jgi:transposase
MCPARRYYHIMRNCKDKSSFRLQLVLYAQKHGVKPATREFGASIPTVRYWLKRFDGTKVSLEDRSREPHNKPRKLTSQQEAELIQLKKRYPRRGALWLKMNFNLPYAQKTFYRVWHDAGLVKQHKRKKHQTKRYLREVKRQWAFCQQISTDTKYLQDIPEYWLQMMALGLPHFQYTARDVTSGLLFLSFSDELALLYATRIANLVNNHLLKCGIDLSKVTWQSDNGSEFIGSWQAKESSAFTLAIESIPGQIHRTIPPGQWTYQSDVETVHSIMEDEFYTLETFKDRQDFLAKAAMYLLTFNLIRKNSGKEWRTPWELIQEKIDHPHPDLPLFRPVFLDEVDDVPELVPTDTEGGKEVSRHPWLVCATQG